MPNSKLVVTLLFAGLFIVFTLAVAYPGSGRSGTEQVPNNAKLIFVIAVGQGDLVEGDSVRLFLKMIEKECTRKGGKLNFQLQPATWRGESLPSVISVCWWAAAI